MKNTSMQRMLELNQAIDLSGHPRHGPYYRLATIHPNMDYCDAAREEWIKCIGRRKRDGVLLASRTMDLMHHPEFECVWIR